MSNSRQSKQTVIIGTSTDIGKTFVTCKIIDECKKSDVKIDAIKPVITGFDIADKNCDNIKILNALDKKIDEKNIDLVSPFRLKTPISPISAAKIEGVKINYDDVFKFCQDKISWSKNSGEDLLIETAGGIMTPICEGKTFLNLVKDLSDLGTNVILVGACFLGGISNILTVYELLRSKNIQNIEIIVNNHLDFDQNSLKIDDFIDEITYFVDCEVFLVDNFFYLR